MTGVTAQDHAIIKRAAMGAAAKAEANVDHAITIKTGATLDVTPDVVDPPDPPTQDELDRAAWFESYRTLQRMLRVTGDVPALLTPGRETVITGLQVSLAADWKNSYLSGISSIGGA